MSTAPDQKDYPRWFDSFCRIHERPWIYIASFAVPLLTAAFVIVLYGTDSAFLGMFMAFALFNDALWRHRLHEIDRAGKAKSHAIDRKFDRRLRVLARADLDPDYRRRMNEALTARGDEALDDFPLPGRN